MSALSSVKCVIDFNTVGTIAGMRIWLFLQYSSRGPVHVGGVKVAVLICWHNFDLL